MTPNGLFKIDGAKLRYTDHSTGKVTEINMEKDANLNIRMYYCYLCHIEYFIVGLVYL
jgi:hypothetical protein